LSRNQLLMLSLLVWVGVWVVWLTVTRDFHPTLPLALVVTTSLVVAYAVAVYVNHLVLLPRLRLGRHRGKYIVSLAVTMVSLTAIALAVIRVTYFAELGPDPDPNGLYKHYIIDLFGMAIHLGVAAWLMKAIGR
jgi:multisubunit Na+/H+ antiporter MnhE subunit